MGFANPKIIKARKAVGLRHPAQRRRPCTADFYRPGHDHAHEPHARPARLRSGNYDLLRLHAVLREPGLPGQRRFRRSLSAMRTASSSSTCIPSGNFKVTVFDQWNDLLVDGLSTGIKAGSGGPAARRDRMEIPVTQWRTNLYGRVFIDTNGDGVSQEERTRPAAGAVQRPLPRRQLRQLQQHRPGGLRGLQRGVPAPELAGGRYRPSPLQADRRARGVRRRRSGRRQRNCGSDTRGCGNSTIARVSPTRSNRPVLTCRRTCAFLVRSTARTPTAWPATFTRKRGRLDRPGRPGLGLDAGLAGPARQQRFVEFAMKPFKRR